MSMNELPELPCDPNISILPFELVVCAGMVAVGLLALLLTSCAGVTLEPCVSVTNADGKEAKACVRIETQQKDEGKRSGGVEEEKPDK